MIRPRCYYYARAQFFYPSLTRIFSIYASEPNKLSILWYPFNLPYLFYFSNVEWIVSMNTLIFFFSWTERFRRTPSYYFFFRIRKKNRFKIHTKHYKNAKRIKNRAQNGVFIPEQYWYRMTSSKALLFFSSVNFIQIAYTTVLRFIIWIAFIISIK